MFIMRSFLRLLLAAKIKVLDALTVVAAGAFAVTLGSGFGICGSTDCAAQYGVTVPVPVIARLRSRRMFW